MRCGWGFLGTLGLDVQWNINDTKRAASRGLSAKERSRWMPPWRSDFEVKDILQSIDGGKEKMGWH